MASGGRHGKRMRSVELYDTLRDTWTPGAPLRVKRWGHSMARCGGSVWVFGGVGKAGVLLQSTEAIALTQHAVPKGTWRTGPPMPTPRTGGCACALQGWVYLAGGIAPSSKEYGCREGTAAFQALDTATQTWHTLPDIPLADPKGARELALFCLAGKGMLCAIGVPGQVACLYQVSTKAPAYMELYIYVYA